jgi:hypothetical protein
MHFMQSRRDFLTTVSAAGAVSALGNRAPLADEGPPEVTTIRIRVEDAPPLGPVSEPHPDGGELDEGEIAHG